MRSVRLVPVAVLCGVLCSGCLWTRTVKESREISRRLHKDMIDFYENMAQAYYLLGYDYYKLHKEALKNNDKAAAEQYLHNAARYKQFYQDLMETVKMMRKEMMEEDKSIRATSKAAKKPKVSISPPQGTGAKPTPKPKVAPRQAPQAKKKRFPLLDRIKSWRRKK